MLSTKMPFYFLYNTRIKTHRFFLPLSFSGDNVMAFMRGLCALLTDAHMFVSAVGVQEAFVCLAHLVLQVVYGLHQLVRVHRLPLLMVPQVSFAKRARTVQTRLRGLHLPADAGVAWHVSRFSKVSPVVVFLWGIREVSVGPVDRGHRRQTLELFGYLG